MRRHCCTRTDPAVQARAPVTGGGAAAERYFILQGWFGELRRLTAPAGK